MMGDLLTLTVSWYIWYGSGIMLNIKWHEGTNTKANVCTRKTKLQSKYMHILNSSIFIGENFLLIRIVYI